MNKRAESVGNHLMWFWTMFLMMIAGGGIAIGAAIFYGNEYDARAVEAGIVKSIILECLNDKQADWGNPEAFYIECGLNQSVLEDNYQKTKIAIRICEENCDSGEIVFQLGSDFEACEFKGKNDNYPKCSADIAETSDKKRYEVIVSSNHKIRRVST